MARETRHAFSLRLRALGDLFSNKGLVLCATLLCLLLGANQPGWSQLPTATILGVAKDTSGAVIPDVSVTARNLDTGQIRTTTTTGNGSYRLSALPVGPYEIKVEHAGFQTEVRSGITLSVSEEATVNLELQVGAVEQTVAVTAEAPLVNTTSGSLGGLVDERKVADLPLNGRNYIDLTLMQPGVVQHKNTSSTSASGVGTWFSSNGAPVRSNNYMLDGAIMTGLTGATSASSDGSTLGIEGVREYRVITNSFSAEYGIAMGSQVVMVSKSGTNQFHGGVFEYFRNSHLDARNFFDYPSVATKAGFRLPQFNRNQFGASSGGPIKKDKTFFFAAYEGLRERLGITTIDNLMHAGCHGEAGATITKAACPELTATSVTIPQVVAPLLALYPLPNLPDVNGVARYTFPYSQPTRDDFGQIRVDQVISTNDSLFVRYTISDAQQINPTTFPIYNQIRGSRSQFGTLSENHLFSATLLSTARFSFSRPNLSVLSSNNLVGPQFSYLPNTPMGTIAIGGINSIAPPAKSIQKRNLFSWSDDLFYSRGRHSLKFGALINHYQDASSVYTQALGTVTFGNIQGFLLGQPTTYNANTPGSILDRTYHFNTLGFYAQDDIRVSSTFTLNLGLRYEFQTVPRETHGLEAALRDVQHDAKTTLGPVFQNMSLRNFSPRFGFAWDVFGNGKTAVRGGFAELYDVGGFGAALNIGLTGTPPFSSTSSVTNSTTNPATLVLPLFFPTAGNSLRTVDYRMKQPHILSYNLTMERQLPGKIAVTLAYAGSRGINLIQTVEGNPTVPQIQPDGSIFFPTGAPRTNPNWSQMEFKTAGGNSWYNALQFGLQKQLGHGLQFQSSYTWGKVIDETQGQQGAEDSASSSIFSVWPTRRSIDRAVPNFDITHVWRFNTIYQLPRFGGQNVVLGKVLEGWAVSGILALQTGYPFSPVLSTNISRSGTKGGGAGIDRPNLVAGRNNSNIILGGATQYFDPSAYTLPTAGFLGTAGRNSLRGPGLANVDFSILKNTRIRQLGEGGTLEFRAEMFNILNHTNFGMPNNTVFTGANLNRSAGVITNTATKSRQIQLALKLVF